MGFASCGMDGNVYFYDLIVQKELQQRLNDKDFNIKTNQMTCVQNIPGRPYEVFVVGSDGKLWHSKDPKNGYVSGVTLS